MSAMPWLAAIFVVFFFVFGFEEKFQDGEICSIKMDFLRLVGEVRERLVVRTAKDQDRAEGTSSSPPCSAVAASQNVSNALDRVPW
jgi:hypothetical protein